MLISVETWAKVEGNEGVNEQGFECSNRRDALDSYCVLLTASADSSPKNPAVDIKKNNNFQQSLP